MPYRLLCEIRKRGLETKCDSLRQEKLREGAAQKKPWKPTPPKKKQTNYCGNNKNTSFDRNNKGQTLSCYMISYLIHAIFQDILCILRK